MLMRHRAELAVLAGILALAFALRLAWALYSEAHPLDGRFNDEVLYHGLALGIKDHFAYQNPFDAMPTAQWPPGYPAFLAVVYALTGESVDAAKVANAVAGTITAGLLYALARLLFNRPSAIAGALLLAVMPGQVFFTGILFSEVLFTCLFVAGLLAVALLPCRPPSERWRWALAAGVLAALAAYVREAGLALVPIAFVYWGWQLRAWRAALVSTAVAAVAAVAALALIAPWTVRNAVQLDGFLLLSSSTGANFWGGHNPHADGRFPPFQRLDDIVDDPEDEAAVSRTGLREGIEYALTHPRRELTLTREKVRILYQDDTIGLQIAEYRGQQAFVDPDLRNALEFLANAVYYAAIVLSGVAVARWAVERSGAPLLPVATVVILTIGYVAFWASPRFHFPVVPVFCLLAGWAVAWGWQTFIARRRAGARP